LPILHSQKLHSLHHRERSAPKTLDESLSKTAIFRFDLIRKHMFWFVKHFKRPVASGAVRIGQWMPQCTQTDRHCQLAPHVRFTPTPPPFVSGSIRFTQKGGGLPLPLKAKSRTRHHFWCREDERGSPPHHHSRFAICLRTTSLLLVFADVVRKLTKWPADLTTSSRPSQPVRLRFVQVEATVGIL